MTSLLPELVQEQKALAHPARIRIAAMLRTGELCACQITAVLGLAPSTVSAHLAELRRAGLVTERKDGRWVHYSLAAETEAADMAQRICRRVEADSRVRRDAAVVRDLKRIPVSELCAADFDITRLSRYRR